MKPDELKRNLETLDAADKDTETKHKAADELLCVTLESLGYHEAVRVFRDMSKWYS